MAVRQQSRIVRFESAAELLDTFGLSKGGKEHRRLVSAFERIFGATIFFGTESSRLPAKVLDRSRFNFLSEAQFSTTKTRPNLCSRTNSPMLLLSARSSFARSRNIRYWPTLKQ